jgi:hypothetical protein
MVLPDSKRSIDIFSKFMVEEVKENGASQDRRRDQRYWWCLGS